MGYKSYKERNPKWEAAYYQLWRFGDSHKMKREAWRVEFYDVSYTAMLIRAKTFKS